ncbi:unnamed protein product [Miscanthus lutarioriparius]|uniref:tRNA dimethylallyltransferase n=1 Tax=Miscanthus lutarioriparius TaxID=422564 RepID=A0A811SNU4_9POAL|nr:unnamed protein product [Miscanthus lutarioriparius]
MGQVAQMPVDRRSLPQWLTAEAPAGAPCSEHGRKRAAGRTTPAVARRRGRKLLAQGHSSWGRRGGPSGGPGLSCARSHSTGLPHLSTPRTRSPPPPPPPTHQKKKKKDTVIVISGPTGAGKSRLALEVARRLEEIISADSVQIYRVVLTLALPNRPRAEMSLVPHHLIDILDTSDDYSAGAFFRDARRATQDVLDRGCVPVVTGGTGLYLRWYIYGKPEVPQSSMDTTLAVWSELADFRETGQWEEAVELVVQAGDPKARDLSVNNCNRLSRSLEIVRSSGSPPSAFALPYDAFCEQHDTDLTEAPSTAGSCEARELDYDFFCIFLASPRIELYRSIDLRCEEMLAATGGLLSEASWLLDIGLQPRMNSATSAIGYKQAMEYLLHCRQNGGESTPQEFLDFLAKFQRTSRNFAKRQLTWFRNEKIYHWVDGLQPFEALCSICL